MRGRCLDLEGAVPGKLTVRSESSSVRVCALAGLSICASAIAGQIKEQGVTDFAFTVLNSDTWWLRVRRQGFIQTSIDQDGWVFFERTRRLELDQLIVPVADNTRGS